MQIGNECVAYCLPIRPSHAWDTGLGWRGYCRGPVCAVRATEFSLPVAA